MTFWSSRVNGMTVFTARPKREHQIGYPRLRSYNMGISFVVCFILQFLSSLLSSDRWLVFLTVVLLLGCFLQIKDTWLPISTSSTFQFSTECWDLRCSWARIDNWELSTSFLASSLCPTSFRIWTTWSEKVTFGWLKSMSQCLDS